MHLHTKIATTRKGEMAMVVYFAKMKEYIDEMTVASNKLDDDDCQCFLHQQNTGWSRSHVLVLR
jgi:hypothetical protein